MTDELDLKTCPLCRGQQMMRFTRTHCYIQCTRCLTRTRRFKIENKAELIALWHEELIAKYIGAE